MLDTETKRRIDSCRNMLVGKVPDPKSQVEQITIALIYKFMDDMDAEAEELGGERSFFAQEYARYGWAKLMSPSLGGFDVLGLYSEAIQKMNENPGIPALFRDIFKNAYLPYRDPETLRAFLKEINGFKYDHSERLGDAFEYLLSVLGSQGDAGQFRTPRHIIDFIVDVVAPAKHETVLDPACGTAGFLIAAYKHILNANKATPLTAAERTRLAQNLTGHDISPDMVRLSLVNLYLHGFLQPRIEEYDTLTSEDKWNESYDVILANPPFMSPKGGIRPHSRFSVQSNRSEVLFVDYIAEHLSANGRAGVIVPEGIIFQGGGAYKTLRKLLVDKYLIAVVSLPAGVFQPYSGVKTSILLLDRRLARAHDSVLFVKVASDGFGLGAQRRAVLHNDLPDAATHLKAWTASLRDNTPFDASDIPNVHVVAKSAIAATNEYNLSGDRYIIGLAHATEYELVELGNTDLFQIESGGTPQSSEESFWNGSVHWATLVDLPQGDHISQIVQTQRTISGEGLKNSSAKLLPPNTVVVSSRATIGRVGIARVPMATNQGFKNIIIKDKSKALPEFVAYMMKHLTPQMEALATGGTFKEISKSALSTLKIPLPPLDMQKEIVAEIAGYQKIIDGARQVVENYKPRIPLRPEWPLVELAEVCEAILTGPFGTALHEGDYVVNGIPVINPKDIVDGMIIKNDAKTVSAETIARLKEFSVRKNDILIGRRGEMGRCAVVTAEMDGWLCGTGCFVVQLKKECDARFTFFQISSPQAKAYLEKQAIGVTMKNLNQGILSALKISLPPLATQRAIVLEIEEEQRLVQASREIAALFGRKIQGVVGRVWGSADGDAAA